MNIGLIIISVLIFLINLPFGYWRVHVRKFSLQWFLAVHIPVPFVVALRLMLGIGWQWKTLPVLMLVFFAGQLLGGIAKNILPWEFFTK